jgi:hypothetical protein
MSEKIKSQVPANEAELLISNIKAVIASLQPHFINLTDKERIGRTMAEGREGYVRMISQIAVAHPDELRRKDDPIFLVQKLEYDGQMERLRQQLLSALEMTSETQLANGFDIMQMVDAFARALQDGRKRDAALDMAMKEVDEYNKRFGIRYDDGDDDNSEEPPADSTKA